jgi:tetratricopeptide (TPR) repeat protein
MDAEELKRQSSIYGHWLTGTFIDVLVETGHVDELQRYAANGDFNSARAYAKLMSGRDDHEAAIAALAPFAATGWWPAVDALAGLLSQWGRGQEAVTLVSPLAASGERQAVVRLGTLLVELERYDEAFDLLRTHLGNRDIVTGLAWRLHRRGHDEELATLLEDAIAESEDGLTSILLARVYEHLGRVDDMIAFLHSWRHRRSSHHAEIVDALADALARHGRIAELRTLAAGLEGGSFAHRLAEWHAEKGDTSAALETLRPFFDNDSPRETRLLVEILTSQGRVDEAIALLRPRALAAGTDLSSASAVLYETLLAHGRHDEGLAFIAEVVGDGEMTEELAFQQFQYLRHAGRHEEALRVLRADPNAAEPFLRELVPELLVALGRDEELLTLLTPPRDWLDADLLAAELVRQGRVAEALRVIQEWPKCTCLTTP